MNQIQKFIILTLDLVLNYILQLQTEQLSKHYPLILELECLILSLEIPPR